MREYALKMGAITFLQHKGEIECSVDDPSIKISVIVYSEAAQKECVEILEKIKCLIVADKIIRPRD